MTELNLGRRGQASISNFVIDLTRQDRGIESRVPKYISDRGYDLANIKEHQGQRIAGAFYFVGIGNEIESWVKWPESIPTIIIDSSPIPRVVLRYLRTDEGALFSVIDYCDILSKIIEFNSGKKLKVIRVQAPLKWQPHEIDGLYVSENPVTLYPIEAKALTTKDQINLLQLRGELETMRTNFPNDSMHPISCQMMEEGMRFVFFHPFKPNENIPFILKPQQFVKVILKPKLKSWLT